MSTDRAAAIGEEMYRRAVAACREAGYGDVPLLKEKIRATHAGASEHLQRMAAEGILGEPDEDGRRPLLP
jgi:hypothetical protein